MSKLVVTLSVVISLFVAGITYADTQYLPIIRIDPTPTATSTPPPTLTPLPTNTPTPTNQTALVTNVVDGDTIDVSINGTEFRVRYIGMDTPEIGEPCYQQATAYNSQLVLGKTVILERDVSETDRFGRLLRYVYVDDTFVNGRAKLLCQNKFILVCHGHHNDHTTAAPPCGKLPPIN